jgi:peptidoglycan/LPS O-acetylase OafA/YrhL
VISGILDSSETRLGPTPEPFTKMHIPAQYPHPIPNYRPDVDGLRAIAVIGVVIFHAFPTWLPGGFVGVDVFFVISGYLITGLLIRESNAGDVHIRTFYARRIKRIFPALIVVLSTGLIAGWLLLTSEEYYNLGKYTAGGAAFLDNFMFWRAAGYFDSAANTKPLLHLWSLGIEEQFYLVWPLMIWLFFRWSKLQRPLLYILFFSSLIYSLWTIQIDPVKDFYSPFTRFWELIIGGILAFELINNKPIEIKFRRFASGLGLFLIFLGFLFIKPEHKFPGYLALLPTIGAALVIFSNEESRLNRIILSNKFIVWFGLISYPLYLWHWPVLSFARIVSSQTPSVLVRVGLVALSILLAWWTYRFIEKPIRFRSRSKRVIPLLCIGMVIVFFSGHIINANDGFKFRNYSLLNADPSTMVNGADRSKLKKSCKIDSDKMPLYEWCLSDNKPDAPNQYIVIGDSKGESLFFGLSRESDVHHGWRMIGSVSHLADETSPKNQIAYESIEKDDKLRVVLLVNALRGLFPINFETGFIEKQISSTEIDEKVAAYTKLINRFSKANKGSVFVIDNPSLPDPNSCVSGGLTSSAFLNQFLYRKENDLCKLRYSDHLIGTSPYQTFISRLKEKNPDLLVFDPLPLLCDVSLNLCTTTENHNFLYSYGDHISDYSSSKIAKQLLPIVFSLSGTH